MSDQYAITHWTTLAASRSGRVERLDWPGLVAVLTTPHDTFAGKLQHPGWSPATFKSGHRARADLEAVHLLAMEHDAETVALADAAALLAGLDLAALLFTTKSHTPAAPRWRVVLPLSRPCSADERDVLWAWAARELAALDLGAAESRDAARFWYWPCRTEAGVFEHVVTEGTPLDVDAVLAGEAAPAPILAAPPAPVQPPAAPGDPSTHRYVDEALRRSAAAVRAASRGERHTTVAREAYSLGGLVGGGHLTHYDASAYLTAAIPQGWEPTERADAVRTIQGQLREGAAKPRSIEPARSRSAAVPVPATVPTPTPEPTRRLRAVPDDADPLAEAIERVRGMLLCAKNGTPRKTAANASTIFAHDPRWFGVLAYDALGDRVVKLKSPPWFADDAPQDEGDAWTDADITRTQAWCSRAYSLDLGADAMGAAIWASAERHVIDPLRDYFNRIRGTWDGVARVDTWLTTYLGARSSPYANAIGRRFLIGAVARALVSRHSRDGEKVDNVPILEGAQGMGKSTALRKLCPVPGLFFDSELPIGDKDAEQALRGKFMTELPELSALSRHDFRLIKAFVTRQVDTYRPSFGRMSRDFPRRCVFVGTTNDEEYLKDPTGNRRWQPVRCGVVGPINWGAIERDRDQLWAEALYLREAGARHDVDSAELRELCEAEQAAREQGDPWEERVTAFLNARHAAWREEHGLSGEASCGRCAYCVGVTSSAVLSGLGLALDKQGRAEEMRVAVIVRALGWRKSSRRRVAGVRVYPYLPPDSPEVRTEEGTG